MDVKYTRGHEHQRGPTLCFECYHWIATGDAVSFVIESPSEDGQPLTGFLHKAAQKQSEFRRIRPQAAKISRLTFRWQRRRRAWRVGGQSARASSFAAFRKSLIRDRPLFIRSVCCPHNSR